MKSKWLDIVNEMHAGSTNFKNKHMQETKSFRYETTKGKVVMLLVASLVMYN